METTILLMRHESHGEAGYIKQQLSPVACARARARGMALRQRFPRIGAAHSSPQPRALATVIEFLIGYGQLMPITTDVDLGDLSLDLGVNPQTIMQRAKELNMDAEALCMQPWLVSDEFAKVMMTRAGMGAIALKDIAMRHLGNTIVVGSHGGSRMEATILSLRSPSAKIFADFGKPMEMIAPGAIVRLVIEPQSGILVVEEYLHL